MKTRKAYRHRVSIPATVSLDIVTDSEELSAAQVEAVLAAHFNFDEGNGLACGLLDGHGALLFLPIDPEMGEWTKAFVPGEVLEADYDDVDATPCLNCPGPACGDCAGRGYYHEADHSL